MKSFLYFSIFYNFVLAPARAGAQRELRSRLHLYLSLLNYPYMEIFLCHQHQEVLQSPPVDAGEQLQL